VAEACHAALRRLQVDYLDLFLCHRPDPETPVLETARAMHDLIVQGKVLYWGTSEWEPAQLHAAFEACSRHNLHPPVVEQPQYNLFHRARVEKELAPIFDSPGLGTTTWSPLASGLLTGKYNQGVPPDSRLNVAGLEWLREKLTGPGSARRIAAVGKFAKIANKIGVPLPSLAVAWCLKNPRVSTVILGASKVEQLRANLGALDVVEKLTPDVMKEIDAISAPVAD
jgi:aryl-alcohol dehydrogenase-like predicted oxidoreductase